MTFNTLKSQVPVKYDLVIGGTGVIVAKGSYVKRTASYSVPRFSTGQINYTDGSHWQAWAQTEWMGGIFQEFFDDPTRFSYSENVDFGPGVVRAGKNVIDSTTTLMGSIEASIGVIICQAKDKTYAVCNDLSAGNPSVHVYELTINAGVVTVGASKLTKSGTVCNAACIYEGFLAMHMGSSDYPSSLTPANGNYGLCLYSLEATPTIPAWTLRGAAPEIAERVGIAVANYNASASKVCMFVAENQTLCILINSPKGEDGNNVVAATGNTAIGPRPVMYTFQLVQAGTSTNKYVTYTFDPIPNGDYVTCARSVAGAVYLGTHRGKVYWSQQTPGTATAGTSQAQKSTFSLLYDAGYSFHIGAMAAYGAGIVFIGTDTANLSGSFETTNDQTHYRVYHLYMSYGVSRKLTVKKLLDIPSSNPYMTLALNGSPYFVAVFGTELVVPSMYHGGVLVNNGYGWRHIMATDNVTRTPIGFFGSGETRVLLTMQGTSAHYLAEDPRYTNDGTYNQSGVVTQYPYIETSKFDAKLPNVPKIARRVTVNHRAWPSSNLIYWKVYYRIDATAAWTLLGTIGGSAPYYGTLSHSFDFPIGASTVAFKQIQLKYEWVTEDNATSTKNVEITDVVLDYALAPDDLKEWSFKVIAASHLNGNDGGSIFAAGKTVADALWTAKEAKQTVSFVDRDGREYNVLVLDCAEADPDMGAGKRVDQLESFLTLRLLQVSEVTS